MLTRFFVPVLLGMCLFVGAANRPLHPATQSVAVLELFTSQGCSSCPSADRLLGEITQQSQADGRAVYALSFHVDYWDRLGWRDPYSSRQASDRQRQYGRQFNLQSVYTPQAVLNGRYEFVGSNRTRLTALLTDALREPASVGVQLAATRHANAINVDYTLTGSPVGSVLNLALVSRLVSTAIGRGENAGLKLVSHNVVRQFVTVPGRTHGQATLTLPTDFDPTNGAVIGYVQQEKTRAVQGAGQVMLR